jgi:hypothetical protein
VALKRTRPAAVVFFGIIGWFGGPGRYGQLPEAIGILDAHDQPMPIGMESCVGWDSGLPFRVAGREPVPLFLRRPPCNDQRLWWSIWGRDDPDPALGAVSLL